MMRPLEPRFDGYPELNGPCETGLRRARILELASALRRRGHEPEVDQAALQLTLAGVRVRCERRASDDGRLWYVVSPGDPIAEADRSHVMDACIAICTLGARRGVQP